MTRFSILVAISAIAAWLVYNSGFMSIAQEKSGHPEKIFVSKINSSQVIGVLGHPLGTVVRVTGKSLGKDTAPAYSNSGRHKLRIDEINGKKMTTPVFFYYSSITSIYSLKEIACPEKGESFDFYVFEEGAFSGNVDIPKNIQNKVDMSVQGTAFCYKVSITIICDNAE